MKLKMRYFHPYRLYAITTSHEQAGARSSSNRCAAFCYGFRVVPRLWVERHVSWKWAMKLVAGLAVLWLAEAMCYVLWVAAAVENCPSDCKCSQKSSTEKTEVNCQKRGLQSIPPKLPLDSWILKMGENFLQDLPDNILSSVPKMESLNLERNSIKSIHPQAFAGAQRLMLLNLQGNRLSKLPVKGFKDLLNLRFLMLGQNQIVNLKPNMFIGMRNLSELDLPLNALTALPPNAFKPLIALKVLDLALNRIQRISPKTFVGLEELLFLNLDNNKLENIQAGTFGPLIGLEMLVLDNNLLSTLTASTLEGLSNLQELYIRRNEIESLPADVFRYTPKLTHVGISGNRLHAIDGNMLANMQGLKEVYLHDNPWKCDCSINSLVHYVAQTRANHSPLQRLRCNSPEEFRDRPIHQLKSEELPCRA
ncbi:Leucine-rich repeat-containing protein 15 [Anabarilius grahami]|uniref:Leucine-rich repeat-containing protein 15 n=1 Tax=Anabarilius grahami TaxID=495550 RepID=A0A3N0YC71_ANAGA|nr:Leucine-rich repeat-containing protein 15 [Anabarilius grahami]